MLPPNRAAELLRRIHKETTEQAQMCLLLPFVAQALVALGLSVLALAGIPIGIYAGAFLVGQVVITGLVVVTMARLGGVIASGLARTGLVEAASPRIVEFRVPEWHVVGAE